MQANTPSVLVAKWQCGNLIWLKVLAMLSAEGGCSMSATDYVRSLTTETRRNRVVIIFRRVPRTQRRWTIPTAIRMK
jgi:hypothetical protein